MKGKFPWKDMLVLGGALAAAIAGVAAIQAVSGRIDGVASMVFVLAAFFVSMYTEGYLWGVAASVIGMLAVNFAFRSPYFAFNFTHLYNYFMGCVWYNPTCKAEDFDDSVLNEYEKANLEILASMDTY